MLILSTILVGYLSKRVASNWLLWRLSGVACKTHNLFLNLFIGNECVGALTGGQFGTIQAVPARETQPHVGFYCQKQKIRLKVLH